MNNTEQYITLTLPHSSIKLSPREFTLITDHLNTSSPETTDLLIKLGEFADSEGFPTE